MTVQRYKTGNVSPISGKFNWDGYTDNTMTPAPTEEEKQISLDAGEVFPPINSCDKGAYWVEV